ncbi:hypothetical protein P872_12490 [Rhodonellum psychrophilum GCM71 = DSM 17998]|uniref:Uncharacterized protein n=1 Tax=Rhodonellum psychrophilum GCM71 = DSM 17998 TaxID=1123057 RepID=U5BXM5_9BACT|nr:hypothetical protein P872_12490 [Rhodonellum psychrophilum GCM71 = DSM 17998]
MGQFNPKDAISFRIGLKLRKKQTDWRKGRILMEK